MMPKILLIDDSVTQLEMLKLQFIKAGFEVETAQNGEEGYKKVYNCAPDLVLSDIIMPNLNGYQLCRLLKNDAVTKEIPVVLLTILDKKIDKFWGNKSGATVFISKSAPFAEVENIVKTILENNPVSDEYKQNLLGKIVNDEMLQNQLNNVLDELLMTSTFLNEFRDLGEYLTQEEVLTEKLFELLGSFVDYNVAGIFFNSHDRNEKHILHLDISKKPVSAFVIEKIKRDFFAKMPGMSEFTIRDFGHNIVNENFEGNELIVNNEALQTAHIVPLVFEGELLGGVCFYNEPVCDYTKFKFYKTTISELSLLLRMRFLYAETEYLSVTDGLTGLYNRRHFEYNIEREFLRSQRYKSDLSLALVDIDFFKQVNDTYGHQFGDYVLRELSGIISSSFRKTDMIHRYGGEEIAIILTETSLENASIPLERLRNKISKYPFVYNGEEINITVSIGLSTNTKELKAQHEFVEWADKALYKAKQEGRNKVIKYSHEEFSEII